MRFRRWVFERLAQRRASPAMPTVPRHPPGTPITFADLAEMPDPKLIPPLDRPGVNEGRLSDAQRAWRRDGAVILRGFIPDDVLDPYIARRARLETEAPAHFRTGWYSPTPYEHIPELRTVALYPPLMRMMAHLIGEPMLLHLSLTGWVSTERNWHQDDYLNPPFVNGWYCAAWIALDRIGEEAGPFEYVPGSHGWPLLRQHKVLACMTDDEAQELHPVSRTPVWPKNSERFVVPAIEAEMATRGAAVRRFVAEKGDVLIWHGRLLHRGSLPQSRDAFRRALISHYSGVKHRPDMMRRVTDSNGMAYFAAGLPLWQA